MSSCISGRAYVLDLENIVKSSSSSYATSSIYSNSNSSSPSSIFSESSNSLIAVSTRKPRTPRKRPNQTYNEAAALLSTACPAIFSVTKKYTNQTEFSNPHSYLFNEPRELLLFEKPKEIEFNGRWTRSPSLSSLSEEYRDDFDTESLLDEEIGEGIDSIMGKSNSNTNTNTNSNEKSCYGYPVGLGIGGYLECNFGFGLRNGVRALKNVDEGNWWSYPVVNVMNVSSLAMKKTEKCRVGKKKKVADLMKSVPECSIGDEGCENGTMLMLKLDYEKVLKAWSDKGSPVPEGVSGSESPGSDIHARLAQIDLFSENGGVREASVNRYKEKRRTRFFSKKIRYQVRKVNADLRPRSKGRFVRRPNSPTCEES
ncbi:protein CHLOROPLAST IMPORT APPARATUS 2-like [Bidens hawaiensis]|uniref:protein CHLOROPLAST IMPORT APPARATUS 2-like n=1 Tax=Bidens hawaiensis TaxID=980011 RepID=UPI00404AB50E